MGTVLKIAKTNRDKLEDETRIKTSLTDEELKNYLTLVQNEIKNQKRITRRS
jgi:DNA-binding TFAR19-related protein (PDSD5 family)